MLSFASQNSQFIVTQLMTPAAVPARILTPVPMRLLPRLQRMAESGGAISPRDLERILGNQSDLMDLNYLRRGLRAARPVCRIEVRGNALERGGYHQSFLSLHSPKS